MTVDRAVPEGPSSDEGDAADFGALWDGGDIDVSDGSVVAVDSSLESESVDVEPFDWAGDIPDGARRVANTVVRVPGVDGGFDLDEDTTRLERLAVLINGGTGSRSPPTSPVSRSMATRYTWPDRLATMQTPTPVAPRYWWSPR